MNTNFYFTIFNHHFHLFFVLERRRLVGNAYSVSWKTSWKHQTKLPKFRFYYLNVRELRSFALNDEGRFYIERVDAVRALTFLI